MMEFLSFINKVYSLIAYEESNHIPAHVPVVDEYSILTSAYEAKKNMVEAEELSIEVLARTIRDIALIVTSMVTQLNFVTKSMAIHKLINLPTLTTPILVNHITLIHHQK